MTVITIGGLAGGGARSIAPIVAERLGSDYVDRLILSAAARHAGSTVQALHQREERILTRGESFSRALSRILERSALSGVGGDPLYFGPGIAALITEEYDEVPRTIFRQGHELEDQGYLEAISKTIHELALNGNVVMVGRGAHVILSDVSGILRVGLVAEIEDRIQAVMKLSSVNEETATILIESRDEARMYFFNQLLGIQNPDDPSLYDLVLNTSSLTQGFCVDAIINAYKALVNANLHGNVATDTSQVAFIS